VTIAVIRHETTGPGTFPTVNPTAGSLMVMSAAIRNVSATTVITGWVNLTPGGIASVSAGGNTRYHNFFYRFTQPGDLANAFAVNGAQGGVINFAEFSGVGSFLTSVAQASVDNGETCGGAITTLVPALIVGGEAMAFINDTAVWGSVPTSPTIELEDKGGGAGAPGYWLAYRIEAAGGTFTVAGVPTFTGGSTPAAGVTAAFSDAGFVPVLRSQAVFIG
jgi:hypothetical protein